VQVDAIPPLEPGIAEALESVLDEVDAWRPELGRDDNAWRRAGLVEAADGAEDAVDYAFSPRSTRGATRA
jgi:hypothetical protein